MQGHNAGSYEVTLNAAAAAIRIKTCRCVTFALCNSRRGQKPDFPRICKHTESSRDKFLHSQFI